MNGQFASNSQQSANNLPSAQPTLTEHAGDLRERLENIQHRVHHIADTLHGAEAARETKDIVQYPTTHLRDSVIRAHNIISTIESALCRVEKGLF